MAIRELMESDRKDLVSKGRFYSSEMEGVTDFIWSYGLYINLNDKGRFKEWLSSPVPFLNNRLPIDILRNEENGEEIIYDTMIHIVYGMPG